MAETLAGGSTYAGAADSNGAGRSRPIVWACNELDDVNNCQGAQKFIAKAPFSGR